MPQLEFHNVSVTVDTPTVENSAATTTILGPVNLTIAEQRVGVIGSNGSGKSTLARLINGLVFPTEGSVSVDGVDVASNAKKVRKAVGFVFSDAENQIIMPRVHDDVAFSLRRSGLSKAERNAHVDAVLARFGLSDHADDSPHTLSGGQKQLLALASVLVLEPALIVADEPTTLLDLRNRTRIAAEFRELEQQLIVVTHDLDLLRDFDRVIAIDNGRVVADGDPTEVIDDYVSRINQ